MVETNLIKLKIKYFLCINNCISEEYLFKSQNIDIFFCRIEKLITFAALKRYHSSVGRATD